MSIPAPQSRSGTAVGGARLTEFIGRTPLLRLHSLEHEFARVSFYGKAEWFNPGGSVKDRPALRMIAEAELSGVLAPGQTILDATSGNTGVAFAWIGAVTGYPVRLVVPENASAERKRLLHVYGADVVYTDAIGGMDGAIEAAAEIHRRDRARYFYADQYRNPANWKAHYDTTAPEIWEQTGGDITHFVAGLGTSGTFVGTSRRLRVFAPDICCVSVEPDGPFHGIEGLKDMESAITPAIYDPSLADHRVRVQTEDAYRQVRRLARREGLLVGVSSGAAIAGALEVARGLPDGKDATIVIILGDSGVKYLGERFWSEKDSP